VTLLVLFVALIVILRPGNRAPYPPIVTPLVTARSAAPQQIMVHSSNQRHTGSWALGGTKFSIRPNFCAILRKHE